MMGENRSGGTAQRGRSEPWFKSGQNWSGMDTLCLEVEQLPT
jgi:hypothetical protein